MAARAPSLRRRLTLLSVLTSASTLLLASAWFTAYAVHAYRGTLARHLATTADMVAFAAAPALEFRDERAAGEALAALRAEPQVTAARIYALDGEPFASYGEGGDARFAAAPPAARRERMDFWGGSFEVTQRIGDGRRPLGTLYLRAELSALRRRLVRYAQITAAVVSSSLVAALAIAWVLQREISVPVLALVDTTRRVAATRDFGVRAPAGGGGELAELVDGFNEMLAQVERRDERLRAVNRELRQRTEELARKNEEVEAFVYIVSHDLRAPLVNLQGFSRELRLSCEALTTLLDGVPLAPATAAAVRVILDAELPDALRYISASTAKFERLINALLELSRTGRRELRADAIDMQALAAATVDSVRQQIERCGAQVVVGALPPARGDETALGQVLGNLLGNALRYLQPGRPGRIELGGERWDEMNRYFVRDNGVGIAESAQRKLFQVFQRFRPDLADGDGIGLATVKRIVERHGGRIWAESVEGAGATFYFTLPSAATTTASGGAP
jgi:signal transduction histidine kinase